MSRRAGFGRDGTADFLVAYLLTVSILAGLDVLHRFAPSALLTFLLLCPVVLAGSRYAAGRGVSSLTSRGYIVQRLAIYGANTGVIDRAVAALRDKSLPHVRLVGFADDRSTRVQTSQIEGTEYLGGFDALLNLARAGEVDQVVIVLANVGAQRLQDILRVLSSVAVDVCLLPQEAISLGSNYRLNLLGDLPVFNLWQQPVRDLDGIVKASYDFVLASIAIVLLSPLLLLTAIAIRLESRGPVFFVQSRFGFNNVQFQLIKFRSMYHHLSDCSGEARTKRRDGRVTRVGRLIRRLSIDELPQLFNVLRGDMSLVGPRPHAIAMRIGDRYYFDAVHGYQARHRVKPGITGLAQVRGLRGEIDTIDRAKRRVEYDLHYIEHWSPFLDFRILFETIFKVVWDSHAY